MFGARFDDATTGRSMVLEDPVDELVAMSLDDVPTAVAAASAASASGRWVAGYVTYEAAPAFDPTLAVQRPTVGPLAWFGVFDSMVEGPVADPEAPHGAYGLSPWTPRWEPDIHAKAVDRVIDRIRSGDTYQINLTFPLVAAFHGDPAALYADLVAAQRPAYATHIHHGDLHVVSSSPERFFSVDGRRIVTSPMKGTTRRGRWVEEDAAAHDRLVSSPKDRAENLMIVDLIRNDLGRIAVFGSVEVGGLFDVEPYPTVWQMTSTVTAELRDDVTLTDVFGALFPCGSVTGAPKPSSMRIIADTEPAPRGVYCGAVGFIPPGDGRHGASFNVAIRTVQLDLAEGFATYGTGGGVTWYSEPEDEYAEAVAKTLVLRRHRAVHGLIETIRWDPGPRGSSTGSWTLLDAHLDRLEASSAYFDLPFDRARTTDLLESTVAGRSVAARVRVETGAGITVAIDDLDGSYTDHPGPSDDVVVLALDPVPIDETDPAVYHKTTNRYGYDERLVRVRGVGDKTVDDVVMVNARGVVTETTIANIAVLIGGRWVTPPRTDGLLAGTLRNRLVALGDLTERSITVADLGNAEAVAVVNSVRGWRPAVVVDP